MEERKPTTKGICEKVCRAMQEASKHIKKVYISIPIIGQPHYLVGTKYKDCVENVLREFPGADIINARLISLTVNCESYRWKHPMIRLADGLACLAEADIIYCADGWEKDRRCILECLCAEAHGILRTGQEFSKNIDAHKSIDKLVMLMSGGQCDPVNMDLTKFKLTYDDSDLPTREECTNMLIQRYESITERDKIKMELDRIKEEARKAIEEADKTYEGAKKVREVIEEAEKAYEEAGKARDEAKKAFTATPEYKALEEAKKAMDKANEAKGEAWDAWEKADKTAKEATATYWKAWKIWKEAGKELKNNC